MGIEKLAQKLGTVAGTVIGNGQKAAKKVSASIGPAAKNGAKKTLKAMDIMAQSARAAIEKPNQTSERIVTKHVSHSIAQKFENKAIPMPKGGIITPSKKITIDPNISLKKQLAMETILPDAVGASSIKANFDVEAKRAVNGAKEVLFATKRQDIPKSAKESAEVFVEQGKTLEGLKAELKDKLKDKLADKAKMQETAKLEEFKRQLAATQKVTKQANLGRAKEAVDKLLQK